MYKTTLPRDTYVIKNGYLYALEVRDNEIVKRFKIKNWNRIKEGI
ncbi:MAG: PQQ-binding-like beta-propeller repeat protein [Candidatus Aminicenantes bacterium]|nr:PQQ-binding-like beta-propeller repeat protein [Candidatus Aminicenantes bacterium]